ncbi:stimulated by retinoic acid gene 6 protein-like isoform X2 [Ptychodera flava]|uniref:stimulated by retinoic acid gene 6 protein-like isoform X2 n=1 Tax=Ptychodera flava TaxID=63121 RepID=UPI003969CC6E
MEEITGFIVKGGFVATDSNSSTENVNCRLDDYIQMDVFVHVCLIPSVTIVVILSFLAKRQTKYLDVCWGRPGMLSPVNFMENYSNRWSYAIAFGATTSMLVALFWGTYSSYFGSNIQSLWAKVFIGLLSVAEIGINFYPFFICLACPYKLVGSSLGFLYAGLWFSVQLYNIIVCPRPPTALFDYQSLVIQLPVLCCLLFLLFRYLQRFCLALRNWYYDLKDQDEEEDEDDTKILKDHQLIHVRRLLEKPKEEISEEELPKWRQMLHKIYIPDPGFRYSPRFICTMVVLLLCLYQIVILFVYLVALLFIGLQDWVLTLIDEVGPNLNITEQAEFNSTMLSIARLIHISQDCWYAACAFTTLIELLFLVHITICFRKHMKRMWRGHKIYAPIKKPTSAFTVGEGLKYSGYQIAYFLWSYLVIQIFLWLVCLLLTYLLVVPFMDQYFHALISIIQVLVPYLSVAAFVLCGQYLLAKYCFVQDRIEPSDEDKPLALKNRRLYHNFSYFLFFYNVAVGLVVCLLRIFIGMILGILFLGRVDRPILMRGYESMDRGFSAYVGMIFVENSHCHPVLVCFCHLLMNNIEKQRRYEMGVGTLNKRGTGGSHWSRSSSRDATLSKSFKRASFHWQVAYTLLNNPSLIEFRKKEKAAEFDIAVHGSYVDPHAQAVRKRYRKWRADSKVLENGGVSRSVFYDDEDEIEAEERLMNKSQFYVNLDGENNEEIPLSKSRTSGGSRNDNSEYHSKEHDSGRKDFDPDLSQVVVSVHDSANIEPESESQYMSDENSNEGMDGGENLREVSSFGAKHPHRQQPKETAPPQRGTHAHDVDRQSSHDVSGDHGGNTSPQPMEAHNRLYMYQGDAGPPGNEHQSELASEHDTNLIHRSRRGQDQGEDTADSSYKRQSLV